MSIKRLPSQKEIDELISFLPKLDAEGFEPVKEWKGGKQSDGTLQIPFPIYEEIVMEFFDIASKDCWCDFDYVPKKAAELLDDENFIKNCTLSEIKTMLTYCVRSERFGIGNWAVFIRKGKIRSLLNRLIVLREQESDY